MAKRIATRSARRALKKIMLRDFPLLPLGEPETMCIGHPAPDMRKPSNPKDMLGIRKIPRSTIPLQVLWELGVAMLEGALKYARHNYRAVGVRASVYYDACARHMDAWWEGEDLDPDSQLSHVTKAIASLVVLRDSMIRGNWVDDRPPAQPNLSEFIAALNKRVAALIDKYPNPKVPFTQIEMVEGSDRTRNPGES